MATKVDRLSTFGSVIEQFGVNEANGSAIRFRSYINGDWSSQFAPTLP